MNPPDERRDRPPDARIRRLQQTALFGATHEDTVAFVLAKATIREIAGGEWFLREGERGSSIYWLDEGEVAISRRHGDENVELRRLSAGEVFGEMALFDFGPRSASVCAVRDSRALEITGALLREIAQRDLEQYTLLTMNLAREMARRLRTVETLLLERGEPWDDQKPPPCT